MSSSNVASGDLLFGSAPPTTTDHDDNDSFFVTDDGTPAGTVLEFWKFDSETQAWVNVPLGGGSPCPAAMTRAALRALRTAGALRKDCHYTITDYNRGNVGVASILLHAVDASTLSMDVDVKTTFDTLAWDGRYDIDTNRLEYLADNIGNEVSGRAAVDGFPWGATQVTNNRVYRATFNHSGGTVNGNTILQNAVVTISGGSFSYNEVNPEANVTSSANTNRNTFSHESNTTISAGDFLENTVMADATVVSSTIGDVDNNVFGQLSSSNISAGNVDFCTVDTDGNLVNSGANISAVKVLQAGNLTISGGTLADSTIAEDAQVTLRSGSNYENRWGASVVFNQVGTGYIRYCTIEGTTTWTNGDVNLSNVQSYVSTVNTTGSAGTISNSTFNYAYATNLRNIPSLTITGCTISNYGQISATGASRLYLYRCTVTDASRILVSANRRLDASYTHVKSYGYIQVTNGFLTANYCDVSNVSYIQHTSTGNNRADRVNVNSGSNARFLATSNNCRIYYCRISSGGTIYHNGSSSGCYFYYCSVDSSSQMYSNNSVNLRAYYNSASGNSQYYSQNVTATHYAYYNVLSAHGYLRHYNSSGGRLYAVHCSGQALVNLVGATAAGRLYYSSFSAYYYLTASNWTVTRSALHGFGRRSYTVTNPPANGTYTQNF